MRCTRHFVNPPEAGKNFTGKKLKRVRRGPDNGIHQRINLRFTLTGGVD